MSASTPCSALTKKPSGPLLPALATSSSRAAHELGEEGSRLVSGAPCHAGGQAGGDDRGEEGVADGLDGEAGAGHRWHEVTAHSAESLRGVAATVTPCTPSVGRLSVCAP